jgi:hypothetical protein
MKTLSAACLIYALLFCSACNAVEFVTLVVPPYESGLTSSIRYSDTITLAAGDSSKVVYNGGNWYPLNGQVFEVTIGAWTFDMPTSTTPTYGENGVPIIAGPATIRLKVTGNWNAPIIATLSITRANSAANVIPANAVVIPEDAGGQFQVVLESSTDLLNWAVANPGTYGGSTPRRFFRTRIVKLN